MADELREFYPPSRLLMGPGPSNVHPQVLQAMAAPVVGHLDPDFLGIMEDVREMLRQVFQTHNHLTLPISGTGTAGMEAAVCNVLEPGDTFVVAINGYFGERLAEIGVRHGAQVHLVSTPWGKPVDPAVLEDELKRHPRVKAVGVVHGETSAGVLTPLPEIAALTHAHDALLIVDAVTSLGGVELAMDQWDIDVCYSCTQKCLGAPPGLSPLSLNPRAMKVLEERKTKVQSFYLDLALLESYWTTLRAAYHHTAPISLIYALREALRLVLIEGLEQRFQRHARIAAALRAGLEALGLKLFADPAYRLDPLTTVIAPEGIDEQEVRRHLLKEYNIEIGGGFGPLKGKGWRIGLMGYNAQEINVFTLLSALEHILPRLGCEVPRGESVAAAQRVLASYAPAVER
ncbi:MAG: pyridoxal-phosphate-dependent aminotransferase family protein [Dehalococcoidia bacterium]